MARQSLEAWLPEEYEGSTILGTVRTASAADRLAKKISMGSDTKKVPRSGSVTVGVIAKGASYPESTGTNDTVILDAVKLGTAVRIAEEDIDDSFVNVLENTKREFAGSYAVFLDNAVFGTTAAANGGTVPFESVYKAVSTADASTGYVADANLIKTAGAVTYADLSDVLAKLEQGKYSTGNPFIVAHPSFKATLRNLVDGQQRPLFISGQAGASDTLFGYTVIWSQGARTNAVASADPTGNPLLIAGNSDFLLMGERTPLESYFIDPRDGASALTDEALLKFRTRKAFKVGAPGAFAVIEVTSA